MKDIDENNETYTSRDASGKECNAIIDRKTKTLIIGWTGLIQESAKTGTLTYLS